MTTLDLLRHLIDAGILLRARGDKLRVEGPAELLTDHLRTLLAQRKAELLAILAGDGAAAAGLLLVRAYATGAVDAQAYWDWDEWWSERAGICEYQGGMTRHEANLIAYELLAAELDGEAVTMTMAPAVVSGAGPGDTG